MERSSKRLAAALAVPQTALSTKRLSTVHRAWRSTAKAFTSLTRRTTSFGRVDLKSKTVQTVAGTGQQAREYFKEGPPGLLS
jgi:hypothetical protein